MTNVTNKLKRPVALRTGKTDGDKVVTIHPGETKDVPGLNTKERFVQQLVDDGSIVIGGATREEVKTSQTEAALQDAQTAVKNAKDKLAEAEDDLAKADTNENKSAVGKAKSVLKAAESKLDKAQADHDKGGN